MNGSAEKVGELSSKVLVLRTKSKWEGEQFVAINLQASYLHAITREIFASVGTPRFIAEIVAEVLVNANLTGHDSHGVLRIPQYLGQISNKKLNPTAEPAVVKETANTLLIDGNKGFGHYTAQQAMRLAIEKAKAANVACASLLDTSHIGRLGEYAEVAARAGCISIITFGVGGGTTDRGRVVPFGGAVGGLSTNPIAVGAPTGDDAPFVSDFATSVLAEGKVQVARSKNVDLPEGCIIDKHGNPSVKPSDFYDGGSLLPFGAHKGYSLALITCLLGGLSEEININEGRMSGVFMEVINVEAFTSLDKYQKGVRAFLDGMKSTSPAPGFDEVLVPGDFEHRLRGERLTQGIDIPETVYQQIQAAAKHLNVSLAEEVVEPSDIGRYQTRS